MTHFDDSSVAQNPLGPLGCTHQPTGAQEPPAPEEGEKQGVQAPVPFLSANSGFAYFHLPLNRNV